MTLIKISVLSTPTTANAEEQFSILILLLAKLRNALVPNSLGKLMQ